MTVEAVAPDSLVGQVARQRVSGGEFRLRAVEGGVETRHLRQLGVKFRKRRDGVEVVRLMQRRQRNQAGQFVDDIRIDANRAGIVRSAMHDAVPGCDQLPVGKARFEPAKQVCDDVLVRSGSCSSINRFPLPSFAVKWTRCPSPS
jgi:hypothetical protein